MLSFELKVPDLTPWRAGNTGVVGVWQFDSGLPGNRVLLSALVHGNELCGAWALKGLLEAGIRPQRGTLTLAFCNLAAFDGFDISNPDASRFVDEDLNRQWTLERIQSGTTQERRRAAELLPFVENTDWLLDLHSMHEPGPPLLLTGVLRHNIALAKQMAAPEHVVVDTGHQDGVRLRDFGRFSSDHTTRSLLVECGFHGDLSSRVVAQDQCARFLARSGVLDDAALAAKLPGWKQADDTCQWVLEVTSAVVATSSEFRFVRPLEALEIIPSAGTVLGYNDGVEVVTPHDDCVLVMPSVRQARAGVTVLRFAKPRKL